MGLRDDISIINLILKSICSYESGTINFESFYCDYIQYMRSLKHIKDSFREELLSYENSFEEVYAFALLERSKKGEIDHKGSISPFDSNIVDLDKDYIARTLHGLKSYLDHEKQDIVLGYCKVCGNDISCQKNVSKTERICDCCGTNLNDNNVDIENLRQCRNFWIRHPDRWHNQKAKPEDWKLEDQMEHIPKEYL